MSVFPPSRSSAVFPGNPPQGASPPAYPEPPDQTPRLVGITIPFSWPTLALTCALVFSGYLLWDQRSENRAHKADLTLYLQQLEALKKEYGDGAFVELRADFGTLSKRIDALAQQIRDTNAALASEASSIKSEVSRVWSQVGEVKAITDQVCFITIPDSSKTITGKNNQRVAPC